MIVVGIFFYFFLFSEKIEWKNTLYLRKMICYLIENNGLDPLNQIKSQCKTSLKFLRQKKEKNYRIL